MAAAVAPGEDVLEVGGGLGVLTGELSRRGASVRVIEIEPALAEHLTQMKLPGVEVECADALTVDLGRPTKVVSNIPYAISGALIERLASCGAKTLVLLVQREVAERIASSPGDKAWARLPAIVQRSYSVDLVEAVPPTAFFPQPRVHSAVVRLRRKSKASDVGAARYGILVGALFAARRKKVRNSVPRAASLLGAPAARAVAIAERTGIADRRPEELSVEQFEALARALTPSEND